MIWVMQVYTDTFNTDKKFMLAPSTLPLFTSVIDILAKY
ncbi:hypothetical protein PPEP_b0757 [Pseudoalteromonas peptidolytica F12-50-A1]|uniref:Uncharacterized protein n=1 Tax=Pseudoalteromonas peptidolytica F12-50-A1 TaxID=1315280 RepID=A0A8I0N1L8_9GAMM|nr:hypothetical protein [Pseudoalteromonas peptidolytica F12-50-A1]